MGLSKSSESRLSDDKRQLKRALDESDTRATELEMNKRALEGEIQRLNMILTDKDTEIQVHQERCDTLIRQIQVKTFHFDFPRNFAFLGSRRKMSIITIKCRSSFLNIS
jgi:TolA-binding protein